MVAIERQSIIVNDLFATTVVAAADYRVDDLVAEFLLMGAGGLCLADRDIGQDISLGHPDEWGHEKVQDLAAVAAYFITSSF